MAHPRALQCRAYFTGCQHFGIYQLVNTKRTEQLSVFIIKKLVVIDACHGFLGAKFLRQFTSHHVGVLKRSDSNEQVTPGDPGSFQVTRRSRAAYKGHKIIIGVERSQF